MIEFQERTEALAYIAGAIDGDGHIGIRKVEDTYKPLIQLHNSVIALPWYMKSICGGTIACDKPKQKEYRVIWKWMLQGEIGCKEVLSNIYEYLVIKKKSAQVVLDFLNQKIKPEEAYEYSAYINKNRKIVDIELVRNERKDSKDSFFWSYVAGLMDTDGSFSIERQVRKASKENRQINDLIKFRPSLFLSMTTISAIQYIHDNCIFGNFLKIRMPTGLRGSGWRFSIRSRVEAIEFIKKCIPHLRIKAPQALLVLNFCRMYAPTKNCSKKVPVQEANRRQGCYEELVRLNTNSHKSSSHGFQWLIEKSSEEY